MSTRNSGEGSALGLVFSVQTIFSKQESILLAPPLSHGRIKSYRVAYNGFDRPYLQSFYLLEPPNTPDHPPESPLRRRVAIGTVRFLMLWQALTIVLAIFLVISNVPGNVSSSSHLDVQGSRETVLFEFGLREEISRVYRQIT